MKRPNDPNTIDPNQAIRAAAIHTWTGMSALPLRAPAMFTATTDSAPKPRATMDFATMYATGDRGVSRSCRDHPRARSVATMAPPLVDARTAPYTAMLIRLDGDKVPATS